MDSILRQDDALTPRTEDGMGKAALLALGAHALLLVALAFGVNWRASEPEGVTAELWAAVPQAAAPAEVAPPPPPPVERETPRPTPVAKPEPPPPAPVQRDADIAIEKKKREQEREREREEALEREQEKQRREKAEREREREREQERERVEQERLAKAKADAAEKQRREKAQAEEAARLAKLREDNLKRIMGQAGATGGPSATGTAARDAGPSASYAGKIVAAIRPNIVSINEFEGNPEAIVSVRAAPDGTILGRRLLKASGDKEWDEEVLRAIDRTARLPRDENGRVPPELELRMRPKVGA